MKIDIHEKYQPLWTSKSRYFVITGGRGSGKSFAISVFLDTITYEEGHVILFTRYTLTSANVSIMPEFIEKIDMMGKHDDFRITKDEIINLRTGSRIIFRGIKTASGNQTAALKSITGVTTFVLDEAEELTDESVFDKIDLSFRSTKQQNRVILLMNPSSKEHWIYARFFEANHVEGGWNGTKDDVTYIHTTYKDNIENLPESFLRSIFDMKLKRPDKYEHQILGGWMAKADGVVFNNWKIGNFIPTERMCYGQDFGFSETDPTTLIKVSVDLEGRKMYVREMFVKTGLITSEIAKRDIKWAGSSLIMCDVDKRLVSELKMKGVNIRQVKYKNVKGAILSGIALMQDLEIIVDPSSHTIIKELNNYVWHESGVKPIDKFNHTIDAIRYAMTKLYTSKREGKYVLR